MLKSFGPMQTARMPDTGKLVRRCSPVTLFELVTCRYRVTWYCRLRVRARAQ